VHTGQSFGKQVKPTSMCRDDVSTVGMQSVSDNHIQYWSQIDEFMESGELLDLCGNEMTELDCDNSQDDSSLDELADCDKSQENVLHDDVQIQINDCVNSKFCCCGHSIMSTNGK